MVSDKLENKFIKWHLIKMSTLRRWLNILGYSENNLKSFENIYNKIFTMRFFRGLNKSLAIKKDYFGEEILDNLCSERKDIQSGSFMRKRLFNEKKNKDNTNNLQSFKRKISQYCESCINRIPVDGISKKKCQRLTKEINNYLLKKNF